MKFVKAIPGLVLILLALAGVYWLVSAFLGWLLTLDGDTRTAVLAFAGVLSVPVVTFFTQRSLERRRSVDSAIRERKTKVYEDMIDGMMRMLDLRKQGAMTQPQMLDFFADITPGLISFGSRGVIKAWNDFRRVSRTNSDDVGAVMTAFEDMLKAVRKDLGHRVWTQQFGELIGIFVNDPENIPRKGKPAITK